MVIPVKLGMFIPVIVISSSPSQVVVVRCQSAVSLSSLLGLQYIMILSYQKQSFSRSEKRIKIKKIKK